MTYKTIIYNVNKNTLTITLNRPDKLNAFNDTMLHELVDALNRADLDDHIRAIIVTGSGRGFCAGADLSKGETTFDTSSNDKKPSIQKGRDGGGLVSLRIFDSLKPIIAAVNGPAVGVGVTMQLPMDIRIASTDAKFGFVFSRRSIVMEACSSWFLPRVVGINQAMEWVSTGRVFNAEEALAGRLVSKIVSPDDLLPTAERIASEIAENTSPVSVALCRQMMWRMLGADDPMEAHKIDSRGIQHMGRTADAYEGVNSFLEKRRPNFTMRPSKDMPDFFPWWPERTFE